MKKRYADEKLRSMIAGWAQRSDHYESAMVLLDAALENERLETVKRIRKRVSHIPSDADYQLDLVEVALDEEAAR